MMKPFITYVSHLPVISCLTGPFIYIYIYIYMEKISWTDRVRNEEVLLRVNEQRNILHEINKRRPTV